MKDYQVMISAAIPRRRAHGRETLCRAAIPVHAGESTSRPTGDAGRRTEGPMENFGLGVGFT